MAVLNIISTAKLPPAQTNIPTVVKQYTYDIKISNPTFAL